MYTFTVVFSLTFFVTLTLHVKNKLMSFRRK